MQDEPVTSHHLHFRSASELADWYDAKVKLNGHLNGYHPGTSSAWSTAETGRDDMRNGTLENLDKAQAIVDELTLHVDTSRTQWQMDIVGAFPDVPSLLAGVPENMWNMLPDFSDKSPLVVWIGLTSQGNIEQDTLVKRGTALAAFVLAMSNIRQVILRPYVALGGNRFNIPDRIRSRRGRAYSEAEIKARKSPKPDDNVDPTENLPDDGKRAIIISWDIQTSPMVLSELMTLARPEVTRYFGIEVCEQAFGKVAANDTSFHPYTLQERKMREALGVADGDMYLPQITSIDPMINNPVQWVQENVARFSVAQGTGEQNATDFASDDDVDHMNRYGEIRGRR